MVVQFVSAKEIIEHAKISRNLHAALTPELLSQTMGGLNGMDMEAYNKGYVDALKQLIDYFETRV